MCAHARSCVTRSVSACVRMYACACMRACVLALVRGHARCVLSCVCVCAAGDSRLHLWSVNRRLRVTAGHFPNAWDIPAASPAPRRTPRRHLRLLRIVLGLGCVHSCACARTCVFTPMASARTSAAPIAVTWSAGSLRQASSGRYLLRPHSLCTDAGIVTLSTKISLNIIDTTSLTIPAPPELLASGGWTQAENERSKVVYQSQVSAAGETCMGPCDYKSLFPLCCRLLWLAMSMPWTRAYVRSSVLGKVSEPAA